MKNIDITNPKENEEQPINTARIPYADLGAYLLNHELGVRKTSPLAILQTASTQELQLYLLATILDYLVAFAKELHPIKEHYLTLDRITLTKKYLARIRKKINKTYIGKPFPPSFKLLLKAINSIAGKTIQDPNFAKNRDTWLQYAAFQHLATTNIHYWERCYLEKLPGIKKYYANQITDTIKKLPTK